MRPVPIEIELDKLRREMVLEDGELSFLDGLTVDQLRQLRGLVAPAMVAPHANRFTRIGHVAKHVPGPVAAKGAELAFGPLMAGRIAASADPEFAVRVVKHFDPDFVAQLMPYIAPETVDPVIARLPEDTIVEIGRAALARGDYLPLGRFITSLPLHVSLRIVEHARPLDLLGAALYSEDQHAMDSILAELGADRLADVLEGAVGADRADEAVALLGAVSVPNRVRLVTLSSELPVAVRDALVWALDRGQAWSLLLPVLAEVGIEHVAHLLDVPAMRDGGVRERLQAAVAGDEAAVGAYDEVAARLRL